MSAWGGWGGGTEKTSCLGCSARNPGLPGRNEDLLKRFLCSFDYQTVETMDPQEIGVSLRNVMLE